MELSFFSDVAGLERLTRTAHEAAERGRWDLVAEYYRERERLLPHVALRPQDAERLLVMDRQIQERARVAQTALASLIRESSLMQERLHGLRRVSGQATSDSSVIFLEA